MVSRESLETKKLLNLFMVPKGVGVSEVQTEPLCQRPPTFKQRWSNKVYLMLQLKAKTLCNAPEKFAWARVIPTPSGCSIFLSFLMLTFDTISYIFTKRDKREGDGRDGSTSTPESERLGKAHTGSISWVQILQEENWPRWGTLSPKPHPRLQRNSLPNL